MRLFKSSDDLSLLSGLLVLLARIRAENLLTISSFLLLSFCISKIIITPSHSIREWITWTPAIRRLLAFPVVLPVLSPHIYSNMGFLHAFFFYKYRLCILNHNTSLAFFPFVLLCLLTWISASALVTPPTVMEILRRLSTLLLLSWSPLTVGPLARLSLVLHKIYGRSFWDWSWFWRLVSILSLSVWTNYQDWWTSLLWKTINWL